jgi:hypothetical protein
MRCWKLPNRVTSSTAFKATKIFHHWRQCFAGACMKFRLSAELIWPTYTFSKAKLSALVPDLTCCGTQSNLVPYGRDGKLALTH